MGKLVILFAAVTFIMLVTVAESRSVTETENIEEHTVAVEITTVKSADQSSSSSEELNEFLNQAEEGETTKSTTKGKIFWGTKRH